MFLCRVYDLMTCWTHPKLIDFHNCQSWFEKVSVLSYIYSSDLIKSSFSLPLALIIAGVKDSMTTMLTSSTHKSSLKGIVLPKMKISCKFTHPQAIQDVGDFSLQQHSKEDVWLKPGPLVIHKMQDSGCMFLRI